MEEFTLNNETEFVKIKLTKVFGFPEETCHWGGYDSQAQIEIKSGPFSCSSSFYISTGEISQFCQKLQTCYSDLEGELSLKSYEHNLKLNLVFDKLGHININGEFTDNNLENNSLSFEFDTDQSFLKSSIQDIENIVNKYGGMQGIKNSL